MNEQPQQLVDAHAGPKDVFTHLLGVIGLYTVVFSFGAIIFTMISVYVPDVLEQRYSWQTPADVLRWPLAILVIVFPIFLLLQRYLGRDLTAHSFKRDMKSRKWLLYLTLFATLIVLIGDLVAVVFGFLNGDLTTSFLLKAIAILVIGGSVTLYYGWNLKKETPAWQDARMKVFESTVVLIVSLTLIWGFWMVGLPQSQRERRFDQQRVNDLSNIQDQIVRYWQQKGEVPESLNNLVDDIRGIELPVDPVTQEPYIYRVLGENSFELCAEFKISTINDQLPRIAQTNYGVQTNWDHNAGGVCFKRAIDPDYYPVQKLVEPF
ncbi:MAG: DUF5671 domain-containing protein [bacterium]|nr:DUF5671 domain-containing protein [bacterium]